MLPNIVTALVFFMGAVLFTAAVVVLAFGAKVWSDAAASAHRARAHGISADEQEQLVEESHAAIDEVRERRPPEESFGPTDAELREATIAEREYTTTANEGVEESAVIPPDKMYAPVGDE